MTPSDVARGSALRESIFLWVANHLPRLRRLDRWRYLPLRSGGHADP